MKNCPTQNNLPAFLLGEVSASERETIEFHLADCADCRRNLALMFNENTENFVAPNWLKEKVKNLPAKESKTNSASFFLFDWLKINRLQFGLVTALIVCFGFVGWYLWQNQTPSNSDDVLRKGSANKSSIKLLAPGDNANLSAEKIEFRWSEVEGAKNYTLILSDEKGDIIKEISSEKTNIETSISAPGLTKEKRYYWHVKVKFADSTTAESENRKIIIVDK